MLSQIDAKSAKFLTGDELAMSSPRRIQADGKEGGPMAITATGGHLEEIGDEVAAGVGQLPRVDVTPAADILDPRVTRRRLMLADAAAATFGVILAFGIKHLHEAMFAPLAYEHLLLIAGATPAFALGAVTNQLYRARANVRRSDELVNIIRAALAGVGFLVVLAFAVQMKELSRLWVGLVGVCVVGAVATERQIARSIFAKLRSSGRVRRRIAIVGTDAHAMSLYHLFQRDHSLGYEVVGFIGGDEPAGDGHQQLLGSYDEIDHIMQKFDASGVVVSPASIPEEKLNVMARRLTDSGYHVAISSALWDIDISRLRPQTIDGRSMIYVEPVARQGAPILAKRAFDVAFASLLLIVTSPLMLAAAAAIKLTSKGPVFFRQTRVGRNGELFQMMKLRTMVQDAEAQKAELMALNEADGPLFKMKKDPRITKVGAFLRKTSIDELPQLFAVLKGTMSMVGPRPALPDEVSQWDDATRERLRAIPGLTGLWQVSGRSDSSFGVYKRLDLYYVDNWSLRHDLSICLRTVGVVLAGSGAR
jgi:exopolysaccharide biosynthesis polyprenyl glycosylphosphotransferase